jgi:hypothetical protein
MLGLVVGLVAGLAVVLVAAWAVEVKVVVEITIAPRARIVDAAFSDLVKRGLLTK